VTVTVHALWMLCALGGVVFATAAARNWRQIAAFAFGVIAVACLVDPARVPDADAVGVVSALAAAGYLVWPRYAFAWALIGGSIGGLTAALAESTGMPPWLAIPAVCLAIGASLWLARSRPSFAPDVVRDDALLGIVVFGLAVAVLPGVVDGWHAAANLTVASNTPGGPAPIPMWTLTLLATALGLGGLYSLWSRR
jgi:hypothetical protein